MADPMGHKPGSGVQVTASSSASVSHSSSSSPQPIHPSGAKAPQGAHAQATTVGVPVEYKVVDQPWQPSDPAATEAMLTEIGLQGWRLTTAYPDATREQTRWIFIR